MQIHELANLSGNPASGTSFVVDNGSATRKIDYTALAEAILKGYDFTVGSSSVQRTADEWLDRLRQYYGRADNAGVHGSIYRGVSLGTAVTSTQYADIASGSFTDMFIGDYWTINDVRWIIADFNTFLRTGYSSSNARMGKSHIVVVPESRLYSAVWNSTASTADGYIGSSIRANIKGDNTDTSGAEAKFIAAFGDEHVLEYQNSYPTAYTNGVATAAALTTCRVELMSEVELFGHLARGAGGGSYEIGVNPNQFKLFAFYPQSRFSSSVTAMYATRTVANSTQIAVQSTNGAIGVSTVTNTAMAVRPFALIG